LFLPSAMKLFLPAALLLAPAPVVGAQSSCDVCPAGLEVADDTAVSLFAAGETATCAQIVPQAASVEDSVECEYYRAQAARTCCPAQAAAPDDPCLLCPDGLEVAEDTLVTEGEDAAETPTCGQVLDIAGSLPSDSPLCLLAGTYMASVCCASQAVVSCGEEDGCAGCAFDGEGRGVTGGEDCSWNGVECFRDDGLSLCQLYHPGDSGDGEDDEEDPSGLFDDDTGLGGLLGGLLGGGGGGSGDDGLGGLLGGLLGGGGGGSGDDASGLGGLLGGLFGGGAGDADAADPCEAAGCSFGCLEDDGGCDSHEGEIAASVWDDTADAEGALQGSCATRVPCSTDGRLIRGDDDDDLLSGVEDAFGDLFDLFGGEGDGAPCAPCPAGLEVADDTPLNFGDEEEGDTCAQAVEGVAFFGADSTFCDSARLAVTATCCPSQAVAAEDPCLVCPDGLEVSEDTAMGGDEGEESQTCGQGLQMAGSISADSPICNVYQLGITMTCCPSQAAALAGDGACAVCPEGFEVPDDTVLAMIGDDDDDEGEAVTCAQISAQAAFVGNNESEVCESYRAMVATTCCPAQAPVGGCQVCPDGFEVPDDTVLVLPGDEEGESLTCAQTSAQVAMFGEDQPDVCASYQAMVATTCCPAQAVEGCEVCPAGFEVPDDTLMPIPDDVEDGEAMTCAETSAQVAFFGNKSEVCASYQAMVATTCCPAQAVAVGDPCSVCPGGIAGHEKEIVNIPSYGIESPCEEVMFMVQTLKATDELCPGAQSVIEPVCCPPNNEENKDTAAMEGASAPKDEENETTAAIEETDALAPPAPDASASAPKDEKNETTATIEETDAATSGDDKSSAVPEVGAEEEPDSGAATVGWGEAAVPAMVTVMLVLIA